MSILFIVTSFWAYGELLIAIEFAKRAYQAGHKPIFLIPPSHKKIVQKYPFNYTVLIPESGKINRILMQDIEHVHSPELVILADFLNYHFCEKHYGLLPEDLALFSGKIGTFDNFDWTLTRTRMDTYGFKAKGYGDLAVDEYAFRLCPCPLNYVIPSENGRKKYYSLQSELKWYDNDQKKKAREKLGISPRHKVLLLTTATWQHTHAAYPRVQNFVRICNKMLERILLQIGGDTTMICVGPGMIFQDEQPAHYHAFAQLPPDEFEVCLQAADAFLSSNIVSTTLAKAILSGIPAVVLYNSVHKQGKPNGSRAPASFPLTPFVETLLAQLDYCYPFRMFPVGWYDFLSPLLEDNTFCQTLTQVEIFDEVQAVEAINNILHHESTHEALRENTRLYRQDLSRLPTVHQILDQLQK